MDKNKKRRRPPPSEGRDLSQKTKQDEFGYPSDGEEAPRRRSQARLEQKVGARSFPSGHEKNSDRARSSLPTPSGWATLSKKVGPPERPGSEAASDFTLTSANKGSKNPYTKSTHKTPGTKSPSSTSAPSTTRSRSTKSRTTHHVVVAISENLARETCVASLDAGRPT